ncbi:hypothetical protein TorRG33x02_239540 [Trema orientale]|uniref:Serine-rich protein-like protein n=1 Tax=Trema orientale TaxID=63057 RepID=A0A2P5DX22_TREOI|nr:hypothetical protein TorRG33x02_239540 [Trema orientale]
MATKNTASSQKRHVVGRTCLCSPTTHPGSFRCSLHRNPHKPRSATTVRVTSGPWEAAMVAKANSIKAFLLQIIKPSSHDLHRRRNFKPRPSRFCLMNNNNTDGVAVS